MAVIDIKLYFSFLGNFDLQEALAVYLANNQIVLILGKLDNKNIET